MLRSLELQYVRSYERSVFAFESGVNIVVGPNASGKTNLLEAVFVTCRGGSFRGDDVQLVQHDADWARIDARFDDGEMQVKFQPPQKTYVVDGVEKKRFVQSMARPVILFEPSHLLLLSGEPERRRAFIDELISHEDRSYAAQVKGYRRTIAQRNRLLKQEGNIDEQLFVWDVRAAQLGGVLAEKRMAMVAWIDEVLTSLYQSVSGNEEQVSIRYQTKLQNDQYASSLSIALKNDRALDRLRGFTGSGPHRDDFEIQINDKNAKHVASRGETRSALLALKLFELSLVQSQAGPSPILLFDDVFGELDGKRRRLLAHALQPYQTIITTTDADVVIDHFSHCNVIPL